jgi:hypothetical protein
MIANDDADNLQRPLAFYPSKDEPTSVVQHTAQVLQTKSFTAKCDYHLYDTV